MFNLNFKTNPGIEQSYGDGRLPVKINREIPI